MVKKVWLALALVATTSWAVPAYCDVEFARPGIDLVEAKRAALANGWVVTPDKMITVDADEAFTGVEGFSGRFPAVRLRNTKEVSDHINQAHELVLLLKKVGSSYVIVHTITNPALFISGHFEGDELERQVNECVSQAASFVGPDYEDCVQTKNGFLEMKTNAGATKPTFVYKRARFSFLDELMFNMVQDILLSRDGEKLAIVFRNGTGIGLPYTMYFIKVPTKYGDVYRQVEQ